MSNPTGRWLLAILASLAFGGVALAPTAEAAANRGGGQGGVKPKAQVNNSKKDVRTNNVRNTSVNNVNNTVNVNKNVNVNVDNNRGGCCNNGWDNDYHPVATAVAVGATVAVTAAVVGSIVNAPPPGCVPINYGGMIYQQCGTVWYMPQGPQYVVINPPDRGRMDTRRLEERARLQRRAAWPSAALAALCLVVGCRSQADSDRAASAAPPPVAAAASAPTVEQLEAAVPENPLKDAYFGETHVHTSYSLDAYIGGARITPDGAYRFARGEDVTVNGLKHNIGRPLDFVAVSDHAEFIGEMFSTQVPGARGGDNPMLEQLRNLRSIDEQRAWFVKYVVSNNRGDTPSHPPFYAGPETTLSAWRDVIVRAARDHYQPGRFTTFAAFEWTAAPKAGNMHRNVIFRDLNVPDLPFSALDSNDEEKLWAWMAEQERKGTRLLAIPHNSNGSKGLMFEPVDNSGRPITAEYARLRSRFERLIEMMQIKGNSEVHRSFWPADEFAGFENADSVGSFSGRTFRKDVFVRWAVIKGLDHQSKLGANPYQLGFTGGTDNHNGLPADVAENDYVGSHGPADGTLEARRDGEIDGWIKSQESNPGSIAGVWATRNTRAAIWDAMHAREAFVTSGPRIRPRIFCGAGLPLRPESPRTLVEQGYKGGVPMGGILPASPVAPTCTVHASKDPQGANLDRIQIVKGWVDAKGEPRDTVHDVAWSGERMKGADGKVPAIGSTVDLRKATYTNDIGAAELMGAWTDPEFDPRRPALYYVRVLEIPTPRWTTYDAVRNGLPLLKDVPATIQERAWTSPIWYTP